VLAVEACQLKNLPADLVFETEETPSADFFL
jgi:hypothetical protein